MPLPEKVENEGIYHPAHKGMFELRPIPRVVRAVVQKDVRQKPWDRSASSRTTCSCPTGTIRSSTPRSPLGRARRRRDLLDDRRLQRAHRSREHLLKPRRTSRWSAPSITTFRSTWPARCSPARRKLRSTSSAIWAVRASTPRPSTRRCRRTISRSKFGVALARVHRQRRHARNRRHPAAAAHLLARNGDGRQRARADSRSGRPSRRRDDPLAQLRALPNAEKKVALFVYNFPPGPGNVGVAYFLDVAGSIRSILETLEDAGYATGEIDATDAEIREAAGHVRGRSDVGRLGRRDTRLGARSADRARSALLRRRGASRRRRCRSRGCVSATC